MRSERDEAMSRHPSTGLALAERTSEPEASPYKLFMDALEDLEMTISLHGTASDEAREARAHVRGARERAAKAWRTRQAA